MAVQNSWYKRYSVIFIKLPLSSCCVTGTQIIGYMNNVQINMIWNLPGMDRCGPLPYIENAAVRHPHVTDVNRITRVDCLPGYRFPNGYTTRTFECLSRTPPELPQWDDTLPDKCEGINCHFLASMERSDLVASTFTLVIPSRVNLRTAEQGNADA